MPITRTLFYNYDPVGTTLNYGRFFDESNLPGFIQTSGSSITTTAVEANGATVFGGEKPFAEAIANDWLKVITDSLGTTLRRRIATKVDDRNITVDSVWDLTGGKAAKLLPFRVGTSATDGRVFIGTYKNTTISWNLTTLGATNVRIVVEVKMSDPDSVWTTLHDETLVATGSDSFVITEPWSFARVGLSNAAGAGVDSIDVYLTADDNITV